MLLYIFEILGICLNLNHILTINYHFVYWIIDVNSLQFILQDCTQIPTDGKRHTSFNASYGLYDGNLDQLNPPITSEIKDGQWLGVEVQSQGEGGKVIVCAHR